MVARDLVMLTIGTGVGGGLVLGGRIYRGATGGAGELGHTLVGLDLSGPVPAAGQFPSPARWSAPPPGTRWTSSWRSPPRAARLGAGPRCARRAAR